MMMLKGFGNLLLSLKVVHNMKVIGTKMVLKMVKEYYTGMMPQYTKVTLKMIKQMEEVD